jgi:uncharacterized membrane protein
MVTAPGNGTAGGDYGRLRASHGDRDRAVDVLKAAFAEGRLTKDEYDERVASVFASRTYADLAVLTSDLPTGPFGTMLPAPMAVHPAARTTNAMAIASLVLALVQPFAPGIATIPAVVCGHAARRQIRRTGEAGTGIATVGLVLGWIGVAIIALISVGVFFVAVAGTHHIAHVTPTGGFQVPLAPPAPPAPPAP